MLSKCQVRIGIRSFLVKLLMKTIFPFPSVLFLFISRIVSKTWQQIYLMPLLVSWMVNIYSVFQSTMMILTKLSLILSAITSLIDWNLILNSVIKMTIKLLEEFLKWKERSLHWNSQDKFLILLTNKFLAFQSN